MRKRDTNGRFSKLAYEDGLYLTLYMSSLKTIIIWLFILFIIFPWIFVISKFNIFQKIEFIFENLLKENNIEGSENGKKGGLFY